MNSYTSTDCYCSVISIAFDFEFGFEFAMVISEGEECRKEAKK
jgi:hypothetical protein